MRLAVLALACVAALAFAGSAGSADTVVSTRSCGQLGSFFNVQFAGKVDGTYWGWLHRHLFAPVPKTETMIGIWTFGSQTTRGPVLYGWATAGRSGLAKRCVQRSARPPAQGRLRARLRVEDGWAYGRRYECRRRGRFVVRTDVRGNVSRVSVWMERSRELLAVAEIKRGSGWIRVSKRCLERDA